MIVADPTRCKSLRKDGRPCGGTARPSGYCWNHDPELEERRREGNSRGGRNRSNAARAARELLSVEASEARSQLVPGLMRAFEKVEKGELAPNVANSMATIARALVDVTDAVDVDERLAEIERRLDQQDQNGGQSIRRVI